jgi:hypothetical protein
VTFDWNPFKGGGGGAFVKFESVGDEVVGTIVAVRTHDFGKGKGPVPLLDIDTGDGEPVTLSIDKVDLVRQMAEIGPQAGDKIAVKLTGYEQVANGTKKVFAVRHKPGDAPATSAYVPPEPEFAEEPF